KVAAKNSAGIGSQSGERSATPSAGSPATAPGAPTLNSATAGNASVALGWSAPGSNGGANITNYEIYRGTSSGSEAFLIEVGNVTSYTDNSAANGTAYYYKVAAKNSAGIGSQSGERSATPSSGSTASAPGASALSASGLGYPNHGVKLNWSVAAANGSPITGYQIWRGLTTGGEVLVTTVGVVTTYTDTGNAAFKTAWYKIKAVNGVGPGPFSNEVHAFSW